MPWFKIIFIKEIIISSLYLNLFQSIPRRKKRKLDIFLIFFYQMLSRFFSWGSFVSFKSCFPWWTFFWKHIQEAVNRWTSCSRCIFSLRNWYFTMRLTLIRCFFNKICIIVAVILSFYSLRKRISFKEMLCRELRYHYRILWCWSIIIGGINIRIKECFELVTFSRIETTQ